MAEYPKRGNHFAHKFTRILHKSCACQDLGRDTVLLLVFIAHTEDAARYSGPVRFWNSQLSETMGFRSPKQLNDARKRAAEAGWLHYKDRGTRVVGEYFVTIPERYQGTSDDAIYDQADASILSADGTNSGTRNGTKAERIAVSMRNESRNELRNEGGTNCGKPSYPSPNPDPSPSPEPNTPPNPQGGNAGTEANGRRPRKGKAVYRVEDQAYPPELDTDEFRAAWQTWTLHRQEIGHPMTPTAAAKTLAKCAKWGAGRAVAAIDHSAGNGWQGLFEPDPAKANGTRPLGYDPDPRGTFAAAAAWMESKKREEGNANGQY